MTAPNRSDRNADEDEIDDVVLMQCKTLQELATMHMETCSIKDTDVCITVLLVLASM